MVNRGFTLIESLISFALLFIIFGLIYTNLGAFSPANNVAIEATRVISVLEEAYFKALQSKTLEGNEAYSWGVCFNSNVYKVFATKTNYAERNQLYDEIYLPEKEVTFSDFLLPNDCESGTANAVIFSRGSGYVTSSGSFVVVNGANTKTVTINQIGLVETQ